MIRRLTDAELIGAAEKQIKLLTKRNAFDKKVIASCAGKFRTISTKGEGLKSSLPKLIQAIDEAILKFFPHNGTWDHGHRSELLNKYIVILDKVVKEDPVEISELRKVLAFCAAIRKGFEQFEQQQSQGRS